MRRKDCSDGEGKCDSEAWMLYLQHLLCCPALCKSLGEEKSKQIMDASFPPRRHIQNVYTASLSIK